MKDYCKYKIEKIFIIGTESSLIERSQRENSNKIMKAARKSLNTMLKYQ
jgi:quinolinate synthase